MTKLKIKDIKSKVIGRKIKYLGNGDYAINGFIFTNIKELANETIEYLDKIEWSQSNGYKYQW